MSFITFKKVTYKNFLSAGNIPIEIDLDRATTTLVSGQNGTGKSTFTEAIVFALFGRSYRGIPKGNLVNSINNRECLVTITFQIGSDLYEVVRGIKPNVFDIIKNGKKLDNDAAIRDQQKYLEQQILKTNMKAFCQVVMLGSAAYVPFMQLNNNARREVIETLLDISVFSNMNKILKGLASGWKSVYDLNHADIEKNKEMQKMQEDFVDKLKTTAEEDIGKQKLQLEELTRDCKRFADQRKEIKGSIQSANDKIQEVLDGTDHDDANGLSEQLNGLRDSITGISTNIRNLNQELKFFADNNNCNSCHQEIPEEHKHEQVLGINGTLNTYTKDKRFLEDEMDGVVGMLHIIKESCIEIGEHEKELSVIEERIKNLSEQILDLREATGGKHGKSTENIEEEEKKIAGFEGAISALETQREELARERASIEIASKLLKDSGIKSQILKQYMPIINNQVNKYLGILNFFVKFHLDENFSETLKSRGRDSFTYNNFSMGERQRIDLSLLFTWREIAKMKNSVNCNLLVFDEVFDSSLDTQGVDDLFSIINTLDPSTRIFIISHKNSMEDKFRSIINFSKVKGFSRLT
jgi:DNA repair exonuclease SbcCD ATPase subunit